MPILVPISDPADPRIAAYGNIRDRDLAQHGDGHEGRFVVEGEVVLRVLATRGRFPVESLLVDEKRVEALQPILAALPADVPVFTAGQAVLDAIVGFHIHRGILALGRRLPEPGLAGLLAGLPPERPVLGLVGIANHDNMGGIFRNAAAFGAGAVLLDETCCDPLYRKALRVSVGGTLVVPFARAGGAEAMAAALAGAGYEVLGLSPAGDDDITAFAGRPRVALLLGAEGPGLPPAVLARTRPTRIAMRADFDSLNVATTSGIALHALSSAR
jgi:tRNA G18 (ribose-2'-O)-methylase SpoU